MSRRSAALRAALLATAFAGFAVQAHAATLTAIAPLETGPDVHFSLLGINDAGWTTGSVTHLDTGTGTQTGYAVLRDPNGVYTTFSGSGAFTQGRAVSNANTVVGYTAASNGTGQGEFSRAADGTITYLTNPNTGVPLNRIAQGINDSGQIVGSYAAPLTNGFILDTNANPKTFTSLAPADGYTSLAARGIANDGTVVGFAFNAASTSGMIYNGSGYSYLTASDMNAFLTSSGATANAASLVLEGVNNSGLAVGTWTDTGGANHGFEFNTGTSAIISLNQLAADPTLTTWGINDSGQVIMSSTAGSFIYDPNASVAAPDGSAVYTPTVGITLPAGVSQFTFNVVAGQTYYIDPLAADGYLYEADGGPLFAGFTAPTGYAPGDAYQLWLLNGTTHQWTFDTDVTGGVAFDFGGGGVDKFELRGLDVETGSPEFVTGLKFESDGTFVGKQTALGVPEPAAWGLMLMGFGLAGARLRQRRTTRALSSAA